MQRFTVILELEVANTVDPRIECIIANFGSYEHAKKCFDIQSTSFKDVSLREYDTKKVTISVVCNDLVKHRYSKRVVGCRVIEESF